MIITKGEIIHALKTEPLQGDAWLTVENYSYVDYGKMTLQEALAKQEKCKTCAVGSILRTKLADQSITVDQFRLFCNFATKGCAIPDDEVDPDNEIDQELQEGNYLGALSYYFETEFLKAPLPEVREKLVRFVTEHFPNQIEIKE